MGAYGRYLIGIIDDADSLSETVQNKLLKTLEEPRSDVILLLGTSNPDHLLSTVRSRCSTIRLQASQEAPDEDDNGKTEALKAAAKLLGGEGAFCEFREAAEKCVKTRGDALMLIDHAEEEFRRKMMSGDSAAAMADRLELCEKARADIERDMDRNKALKRLRLELAGH
jgi:DNA polymerase III delta prime subunit